MPENRSQRPLTFTWAPTEMGALTRMHAPDGERSSILAEPFSCTPPGPFSDISTAAISAVLGSARMPIIGFIIGLRTKDSTRNAREEAPYWKNSR